MSKTGVSEVRMCCRSIEPCIRVGVKCEYLEVGVLLFDSDGDCRSECCQVGSDTIARVYLLTSRFKDLVRNKWYSIHDRLVHFWTGRSLYAPSPTTTRPCTSASLWWGQASSGHDPNHKRTFVGTIYALQKALELLRYISHPWILTIRDEGSNLKR